MAAGTPAMVEGGWYGGQQLHNGQLGAPGVINNPNQQGYGQAVSQEVVAQTNPNNVAYLQSKGAQLPSNNSPTQQNNGGGGAASFGGNAPPTPNLQAIYDSAYTNNPDVAATNASITGYQKDLSTKQQALADAQKNINDNPFYAEATRTGKLAKLETSANADMTVTNNNITTAQAKLSSLQAEAERQVNIATGQYSMNNAAYKQNLDEFNTLLSQGALENATPSDLAGISASTGISQGMLQSIQSSQQAKNTQVITSTDNAGNLTIAAINSKTGQLINQEVLGGVGKAKTGKGGTGTGGGKVDENGLTKQDYLDYLSQDVQNGVTLKSLVQHYGNKVPVATIYQNYSSNSSNGAPKETLAQVKAGQYADEKGFVSKTKTPVN